MKPCVCGCPMHGGTCPHCGCSYYESDGDTDTVGPDWPGPDTRDLYRYESVLAERGDLKL